MGGDNKRVLSLLLSKKVLQVKLGNNSDAKKLQSLHLQSLCSSIQFLPDRKVPESPLMTRFRRLQMHFIELSKCTIVNFNGFGAMCRADYGQKSFLELR